MPAAPKISVRNLLRDLPSASLAEVTETLATGANVRIERIVSMGQASPDDFWYEQPQDEWVILLSGNAGLCIEGQLEDFVMSHGDTVLIPARCRHRVTWTAPDEPTIWLAVFMGCVSE